MKKIIMPIAIVLLINNIWAQQSNSIASLPKIIPPSPTAYTLGNYGNVPVGLFTGIANISVPLITYKTNNINLPLTLSYGSNGIKVDEVSSNVGLGWNLNFGGVITRMVRDKADESSTHIKFPDVINGPYNDPVTNQFLYTLGNGSDILDTEADLYSFNFGFYSGKFFFDQNNQPHIIDQQAIKIERIGNTNGDGQDFLLTAPTGEKYYFTEKERTTYRSSGNGHTNPSSAITAWYLTKLQHPSGDEVYFTYDANTISPYIASQSQTLRMSVGFPAAQEFCNDNGGTGFGRVLAPSVGTIVDNTMNFMGKRIVSISSNNLVNGTLVFSYEPESATLDIPGNRKISNINFLDRTGEIIESTAFGYLNTANKRNFLNSIIFKDAQKKYSFEYENPEEFPARLSTMQDHWGYYNGVEDNLVLVPKDVPEYGFAKLNYGGADKRPNPEKAKYGMLKKVIYPTKGNTELEYEGNTYWGEKIVYPDLYTKILEIKTDNSKNNDFIEYQVTSPVDQTIKIDAALYPNGITGCATTNATGHYAGSVEVNQGTFYNLTKDDTNHLVSVDVVAGSTTKVTLHTDFRCSKVRADISYYPTVPQIFNTNLETGGVRIKSTKDNDPALGQILYKRYYYAHKDELTKSSGYKGRDPYYVDVDKWQLQCNSSAPGGGCGGVVENSDLVLSSSSLMSLYDTGTMSCLYPFVTISEGGDNFENGGEMKQYKVRKDDHGSNIWGSGNISFSPWTNKGWDNGAELKSIMLRKKIGSAALGILREKENVYENNSTATFELRNYTGRKLYDPACGGIVQHPYTCTDADVIKPNNICNGLSVGTPVNLADVQNIEASEYRLISYWHYLKSQKTTDYLNDIPVQTQTEYFYNNPSHYQLTQQKNTYPDGAVNETIYSYAHEKNNQVMIDKNMVGIPLETKAQQTVDNVTKVISREETIYPTALPNAVTGNLVLPLSEYSYDTLSPTISSKEVAYEKYDDKGNILQYREKDGTPVSIVWGYNKTKPIAKIEGAVYSQIENLIAEIVAKSDEDATDPTKEAALLSAFENFNPIGHVTTYTYDPLIGVTTITPPSGIRELYVYDSANRLKQVKVRERDDAGNYSYKVIKEFKYNYKQ